MKPRSGAVVLWLLAGAIALPWTAAQGQTKERTAGPAFPRAADVPGVSAALAADPPYRCLKNYYVDATGGNDSNPGTKARPWKTIQRADTLYRHIPHAGECINVLPGVYPIATPLILARGGDANAADGYVVYRSVVPQGAHLVAAEGLASHGNGDMIMLWAPYLIVDGFEVDGKALTPGHGIDGCAGGGQPIDIAHHFIAINNVVHDLGGAGLSTCTADHVIWRNNVVYNTSSTNRYQTSALSVWQPKALAPGSFRPTPWDDVRFGIVIAYNIAYDNGEGPAIPGEHTDGNGIIIDTTLGSAECAACGTPYPGNILVLGNVAYGNGGGGIHVFLSRNVTVANNTAYGNYRDRRNPGRPRGELSNIGSTNVDWINNIAIARPGDGVLAYDEPIVAAPLPGFEASGAWIRNITFGAPSTGRPSHPAATGNMIGVDPELASPEQGDFHPLPGSPAPNAGAPQSYLPGPAPNIGAY